MSRWEDVFKGIAWLTMRVSLGYVVMEIVMSAHSQLSRSMCGFCLEVLSDVHRKYDDVKFPLCFIRTTTVCLIGVQEAWTFVRILIIWLPRVSSPIGKRCRSTPFSLASLSVSIFQHEGEASSLWTARLFLQLDSFTHDSPTWFFHTSFRI